MAIIDFTDLWIIHFDNMSYASYRTATKSEKKNNLKKWILKNYLRDFQIMYHKTGKPYIDTSEDEIYFSFSTCKSAAVLVVSSSEIGVDAVCRSKNLVELVNWSCPWAKLQKLHGTKGECLLMSKAQQLWCQVESYVKLSNSSLLEYLGQKESIMLQYYLEKTYFVTIMLTNVLCVIAKKEKFEIRKIFNVSYKNILD